jgi:hypothetical protein
MRIIILPYLSFILIFSVIFHFLLSISHLIFDNDAWIHGTYWTMDIGDFVKRYIKSFLPSIIRSILFLIPLSIIYHIFLNKCSYQILILIILSIIFIFSMFSIL